MNPDEAELDLDKTKENLWQLITLQSSQYESVLQFLDESIPKLKKKQQEDMSGSLSQKLYQLAQRIHRLFLKNTLEPLTDFTSQLKNSQ